MGSRIQLAGAVAITRDGASVGERSLPGRQPRLAFAYLVLERRGTVSHTALADVLWPEGPPGSWQSAVRGIASKVRAFLDAAGLDGARTLTGEAGRYDLTLPDHVVVDVEAALADVGRAEEALAGGRPEEARAQASSARAVLVLPFLAGVESSWADPWRQRLAEARARSLEVLGFCRLQAGEVADAVSVLEEAVTLDPLRESAWRGVMRAHAAAGNSAKALEAYERLRQTLAEELGTDPSPATSELHLQLLQHDVEAATPPAGRPTTLVPYRGLATFEERHAELFFGRDADTSALLERLGRHHFVAVVGPSGSGKSSVVRAGLLPALANGALPDSDTWLRVVLRPGDRPVNALTAALEGLQDRGADPLQDHRIVTDPTALQRTTSDLLAGRPPGHCLLIVVDQFEEVFTQARDDAEREAFVAALLHAAGRPDGRTLVVITLRADFYDRAARHHGVADGLNWSQYVVGPLDPDGLEQAIEGPARHVGARLESGLSAHILTDVAHQPGALPLLQHALLELWDRREDGVLTRAAYDDIGGVAGALARRAEDVHASLERSQQAVARRVLLRLTEPGETAEDTRRRATMTEIQGVGEPDDVRTVVAAMVDARLLTTSLASDGTRQLEVAHEALIRGWPRLADWIDEDRQGLRLHRRMTDAAREWGGRGGDEDLLWRGARLLEAQTWAMAHPDDVDADESAFLQASTEARQRAERRRRLAQRTVLVTSVAAAAALAVLSVVALRARDDAQRQGDLARSRELAAQSSSALQTDIEAALLLALEAYDVAATPEAEAAVRTAHAANPLAWRSRVGGSVAEALPDGDLVFSFGEGGVFRHDPADGTVIAQVEFPDSRFVYYLDVADDGRVAVALQNADARVLDADLQEVARLPSAIAIAWSPGASHLVMVHPTDGMFVADGESYEVLYSRPPGEVLDSLGGPYSGGPRPGSFSPDGLMLTTRPGGGEVAVHVVDVAAGREVHTFTVAELEGVGAFSPDGRLLALEADGSVVVHATDGWAQVQRWPVEEDVVDLAWIDDDRLATITEIGIGAVREVVTGRVTPLVGLPDARSVRVVDGLVLGFGGRMAILWDPTTGARLQELIAAELAGVDGWQVETTDTLLLVGSVAFALDTSAVIAEPLRPDPLFQGPYHRLLADGRIAAVSGDFPDAGLLQVLDPDTMRVTHEVPAMGLEEPAVDDTGTRVAVAAPDTLHDVVVYDTELQPVARWTAIDPERDCPPEEFACHISQLAFAPDGRVGVGTRGGQVRVYESDGTLVLDLDPSPVHAGARMRLVFEADGEHLIRAALDNAAALERIAIADGHSEPVAGHEGERRIVHLLTRDPGSGTLALADDEGRVTIRATGAGAPDQVLETGTAIRSLHFAGPDRLLVTSIDRAVLWDLSAGRPVAAFGGNPSELRGGIWLGEDRVATLGRGGDVRLHRCRVCGPIDQVVAAARESLTRQLTEVERALYLGS